MTRGAGPAFSRQGNYDFRLIYSCARAWVQGQSPYERDSVSRAWRNSGGDADLDPTLVRGPATYVYPPPALAILGPFAALPWPVATFLWAILNTVLTGACLLTLARLAKLEGVRRLAFVALSLSMSPLISHARQGQTAIVVLACVCGAAALRGRGRSAWAGMLLGLGACLKPQLGFLFILYEAGRLRWKPVVAAFIVGAALSVVGAGRMNMAGVDWWPSWQRNIVDFTAIDDANPTKTNPIRYQVVNLHYPLHNFTDNRELVRWAVYGIVGSLCAAYFFVDRRRGRGSGDRPSELASLGFVGTVTLIVAYHRPYDAVILAIPLALTFAQLRDTTSRVRGLVALGLILIHALPLPILFTEAGKRGWIPAGVVDSAIWQNVLLPCQAYALVLLAMWLTWMRWKQPVEAVTQRST